MRFAALGDSFTEGVGDELEDGRVRGWADLVAAGLGEATPGGIEYVNLAIRGRLIKSIFEEQFEAALNLDPLPTLISFNGGGNDMMRPGFGVARAMGYLEQVADRCAEAGIELLVIGGGDPSYDLPRGATIRKHGDAFLKATLDFAATRPSIRTVDNWSDQELRRPAYWDPDRLHLNALGHARVAARVLSALGVDTPLPEAGDVPEQPRGFAVETKYYARYVLPWLARRITRRSSGDGRVAKYPTWTPVPPERT